MSETMLDLLRLMNIPTSFGFVGIVRTSDGMYLGMSEGDIGYNHFLGCPSPPHEGPGREAMLLYWDGMSDARRDAVWLLAFAPPDGTPIPLHEEFGVPLRGREWDNE